MSNETQIILGFLIGIVLLLIIIGVMIQVYYENLENTLKRGDTHVFGQGPVVPAPGSFRKVKRKNTKGFKETQREFDSSGTPNWWLQFKDDEDFKQKQPVIYAILEAFAEDEKRKYLSETEDTVKKTAEALVADSELVTKTAEQIIKGG